MRRFFVFLGVVLTTIGSAVSAQEVDSIAPLQKSSWGDAKTSEIVDFIPDVSLDTRFGYNQYFPERSGRFGGDGLYLNVDGYISPNFSYSLQQRLASTYYEDNTGFNGTNWLTLTYEVGDFAFTAGKDGLLVGSFEYDTDDLDSYYDMNSMFYNMFDCWQWGVSAEWYPTEEDAIIIQVAQSPFYSGEADMFAYALGLTMESDYDDSYYTLNMWEYEPGKFVKAVNLATRLYLGNFTIDVECMTRAASLKRLYRDDTTLILAPSYNFGEWGRAFAKFGMETVAEGLPYELAYEDSPGSDYMFYGAGFEYFPLRENKDIRLHAAWSGNNLGDNWLNVGLKWRFDLTSAVKHLFRK